MTLKRRLVILFVALTAVVLFSRGAAVFWDSRAEHQQAIQDLAEAKAREIRLLATAAGMNTMWSLLPELSADSSYLQICRVDGEILAKTANLGDASLPVPPIDRPQRVDLSTARDRTEPVMVFTFLLDPSSQDGPHMAIAIPVEKRDRLLRDLLLHELITLAAALAAAFVLGRWFAKRTLDPIIGMSRIVQQITRRDLHNRLDSSFYSADEIGGLARTFNGLLDRLSHSFLLQERFISDASHELRSPLTAIRGHAQLLQLHGRQSPDLLESGLASIDREAERLGRLVDDMLTLARSGDRLTRFQDLNLTVLLHEILLDLAPLHPRLVGKGPTLPLPIHGDPDAVRRIFQNLIDNALRVSADHEPVMLAWQIREDMAEVTVTDRGPGIEAEHLKHLFERFYRVDQARDRSKGGSGLGLAIVRELVELHGGHIDVTSQSGQGTSFTVRLPLNGSFGTSPA